jgi:hypothetical protein
MSVYVWSILWPFRIFFGYLMSYQYLVYWFPFWYVVPRKKSGNPGSYQKWTDGRFLASVPTCSRKPCLEVCGCCGPHEDNSGDANRPSERAPWVRSPLWHKNGFRSFSNSGAILLLNCTAQQMALFPPRVLTEHACNLWESTPKFIITFYKLYYLKR